MSEVRLTDAQKRAIIWLAPDAEAEADRTVSSALQSATLYHPGLVQSAWRKTPRGRNYLAYRLTGQGCVVRTHLLAAMGFAE